MSERAGRPELPDPPDPPGGSHAEPSWSDPSEGERSPSEEPEEWPTGLRRMPDASEWVGILVVVLVVLLALWGVVWVLGQIFF